MSAPQLPCCNAHGPLPSHHTPRCWPGAQFSLDDSSATVDLGHTKVMAVVTAALEAPYPDRCRALVLQVPPRAACRAPHACAGMHARSHLSDGCAEGFACMRGGRPNEGSIRFEVDFSPMASPLFEGGRPGEGAIEATRLLERTFRAGGAVDLEALCVVAGSQVSVCPAAPESCKPHDASLYASSLISWWQMCMHVSSTGLWQVLRHAWRRGAALKGL